MAVVINPTAGEHPSARIKNASREVTREARALAKIVRGTLKDAEQGVSRASRCVPGYMRLARWRLSKAEWRAKIWNRVVPLSVALVATVSCALVSQDGGNAGVERKAPFLSPLPPELAKTKRATPEKSPWAYVLPIDHGVRADESGDGSFRAPRFHGEHNGIDLLAPVGTPTFAACDGQVMSGVSGSFGRWAHVVCPVPDGLVKDGSSPWASFFYAHLDKLDIEQDKWLDVAAGTQLGTVGKSGNARGPNVQPHLHLELIVQANRRSAMEERHLGRDQTMVQAAEFFASALDDTCLQPLGLQPKSRQISRARRVDPFLALICLSP